MYVYLAAYLSLDEAARLLDDQDDTTAGMVRDAMDRLWRQLTTAEREIVNKRNPDGIDVDDFIDRHGGDPYARFVLNFFRMPAVLQVDFRPWTERFKLFCDHEGKRYRVNFASRLGDICLTRDFARDAGHELRVAVAKCSNWSPKP
jgi:hypothetical protein